MEYRKDTGWSNKNDHTHLKVTTPTSGRLTMKLIERSELREKLFKIEISQGRHLKEAVEEEIKDLNQERLAK